MNIQKTNIYKYQTSRTPKISKANKMILRKDFKGSKV
jgi:hypothetical protein